MANVPGYATQMVKGADTNTRIRPFQVRDKSGLAVVGNHGIENMRSMVEVPAVAPTMAGPQKATPRQGFMGAIKLNVPIGYEVG